MLTHCIDRWAYMDPVLNNRAAKPGDYDVKIFNCDDDDCAVDKDFDCDCVWFPIVMIVTLIVKLTVIRIMFSQWPGCQTRRWRGNCFDEDDRDCDDIYDDNYDGDFDDDGCHADRGIMNHEEGFDLIKVLTAPSVMTIVMVIIMMTLMMMIVIIADHCWKVWP